MRVVEHGAGEECDAPLASSDVLQVLARGCQKMGDERFRRVLWHVIIEVSRMIEQMSGSRRFRKTVKDAGVAGAQVLKCQLGEARVKPQIVESQRATRTDQIPERYRLFPSRFRARVFGESERAAQEDKAYECDCTSHHFVPMVQSRRTLEFHKLTLTLDWLSVNFTGRLD
jgi:hypothetical protein